LCGKRGSRVREGAYYDWLSQKPKAIMDTWAGRTCVTPMPRKRNHNAGRWILSLRVYRNSFAGRSLRIGDDSVFGAVFCDWGFFCRPLFCATYYWIDF
jgi:hypothetical protein